MNPKNILTELKRRNVYRAAVAYGVVAWFLTQLTTQVFPFFEIPNSAVRFVVIALAVGFPIAMLLSWIYELTPQGVVRTEDLDPVEARSVQRRSGRLLDFIIIGALLLVIAMLVVGRLPFYRQTGESISQKSIAVLPFENLSEDKANAYFAEGIQEEIPTRLARVADLKVISRTSTERYQNLPTLQNRSHGSWRHTSRSLIGQRRNLSSVTLNLGRVTHSPVSGSERGSGRTALPVCCSCALSFLDHPQFLAQLDHAAIGQHAPEIHAGIDHAIPADHRPGIDHCVATDLRPVANDRAEFS